MLERDRADHRAIPCAGIGVAPRVVIAKEDFGQAAIDKSADCADVAQLGGLQLERLRRASVRQALAGNHSTASLNRSPESRSPMSSSYRAAKRSGHEGWRRCPDSDPRAALLRSFRAARGRGLATS